MKLTLTVLVVLVFGHMVSGDVQQQKDIVSAASAFAQRLHQNIARGKHDIVYSPHSVHSALTMTYLGAGGDTAKEMSTILNLDSLPERAAHDAYHGLISQLSTIQEVKVDTAKGIYVNPSKAIEQDYQDEVKSKYLAKVENVDFTLPDGPEKAINDYVAQKTEDEIKDILSRGSVDVDTQLVVVDSLLVKGSWSKQFDNTKTVKQDFNQLDGAITQVDMMKDDRVIPVKRDYIHHVDVAEVSLKGDRVVMYVALPHQMDGIADLEDLLSTADKVDELLKGLTESFVRVSIPKMKIDTRFDLKDALKNMGMVKAFDQGTADFTGISQDGGVYISMVVHEAVIDVQEQGIDASAAAEIQGKTRSTRNVPVESFTADHPFLFFLQDKQTKDILIQGKFYGENK